MRDFFERQESARKRTGLLIALFFVAVILIIVSVYIALSGLYYLFLLYDEGPRVSFDFWDSGRFIIISIIALIVIACGTAQKTSQLKGGGYRVAQMLGGRLVSRDTADLDEKKLLNVVEEMAIASGVPVPDVYVMDRENGINAFAAGHGTDDAVVCVTKGCLSLLGRDELQGVVAHEFSHIFNGDMLMNIRLMGWLHGILLISLGGEALLRSLRYVRGRGAIGAVLLGAVLYVLGSIGMFFGKLIKSAVSRQREFLADASAVQFTRNPSSLAGALKKIGGLTFGSRLVHPRASEASHMYMCEGVGGTFMGLMATHPPLIERILRLDPHFDGVFPTVKAAPEAELPRLRPVRPGLEGLMPKVVTGAVAVAILESVGAPMNAHAKMARELISAVPEPIRMATHEPSGARALIYVLLLDSGREIRSAQIDYLREFESYDIVAEADTIAGYMPSLSPRLRLPLVDMSLPALRRLPEEEYKEFKENVRRLTEVDGEVSLFEYVLGRVLIRRLDAFFMKAKPKAVQIYGIRGVVPECSVVLSALARAGQTGEDEAARAFANGKRILLEPRIDFDFLPAGECTFDALDRALDKLSSASPLIKKKLLAACLECLIFDKAIRVEEAELFRAIGESLGIPMPPWLMFQGEQA